MRIGMMATRSTIAAAHLQVRSGGVQVMLHTLRAAPIELVAWCLGGRR
jgi:hypothetical protein